MIRALGAGLALGGGLTLAGNFLDHGTDVTKPNSPARPIGTALGVTSTDDHIRAGRPWNLVGAGAVSTAAGLVLAATGHGTAARRVVGGAAGGMALAESAHYLLHDSAWAPLDTW